MIVAGIDPGLNGGLAIIGGHRMVGLDGKSPPTIGGFTFIEPEFEAMDLPTMGEGKKRQINAAHLSNLLAPADRVVIEQVHAMPGQGVSSMFRFGMSYGQCLGVVAALDIPLTIVTPRKWKGAIGLTADKEVARLRAIQEFPAYEHYFRRKRDHNRAEAALLAHWYLQTQRGNDR